MEWTAIEGEEKKNEISASGGGGVALNRALRLTSVVVAFGDAKIIRADQSSSLRSVDRRERSIRVFLIRRHEKYTRATTTLHFSRRASRELLITPDPSWVALNALKLGLALSRRHHARCVSRATESWLNISAGKSRVVKNLCRYVTGTQF